MERVFEAFYRGRAGIGLLLVRIVMGPAFMAHGLGKVQDPAGFAQGLGLPTAIGGLVGWTETLGGLFLLLGLLTPLAALGLGVVMVGALLLVHFPAGDPFVGMPGSFELPAVYLALSLLYLLMGPGAYSLDSLLFGRRMREGLAPEAGENIESPAPEPRRRGLA